MKKRRSFLLVGILLLALFVAVSVFTFHRSRNLLEKGYLTSEGSAAENFAMLTAANIKLTNAQVEKLKSCTYAQLMASVENESLRKMMNSSRLSEKVHFAYIMVSLPADEVRYCITDEIRDSYDAPVGTKLDIMWLLDVTVGQTAEEQNAQSNELTRYAYYIPEDEKIFSEAPTYIFNSSEWGDHICGYAPLYSAEGQYIGVVGVELEAGDYFEYCDQAVLALGILMSVSLCMLSLLFAYIYLRYRRVQFDKVYLDALVQVYNRSYFNTRFCRYLNTHRGGRQFAMMIADVDWFKKVNDTFGHEVGDEVLIELGAILTDIFGKSHVIRLGGEEFVVALWFDDLTKLSEKLDALYQRIRDHRFSSREITLSISLGCSYTVPDEINGWLMSNMLRAADCKLYEAKESGRSRFLMEKFDETKPYAKGERDVKKTGREDKANEHT